MTSSIPTKSDLIHENEALRARLSSLQKMEELERNVASRAQELEVLYKITAIAGETPDNETLLNKCLEITLQAVGCVTAVIHLIDPTDHRLKIAVRRQFPEALQTFLELSGHDQFLWARAFFDQTTVQVPVVPSRSFTETPDPVAQQLTYLGAPIRSSDGTIGVLSLFEDAGRPFVSTTAQLVSAVADQIGLALESARLRKQAEQAIILQERQRLARNLHDSVTQSLYALVISADVGKKLLRLKDYAGLRTQLTDIGQVTLQALKEMRLMLFELHPSSLENEGLVGALEIRLNAVERRAGIDCTLQIDGNIDLPPQIAQEIYRIAIEALNNSLKHSQASSMNVSINIDSQRLVMEVRDNGLGFDLTTADTAGGIGLSSMRERARSLGGTLEVCSEIGQGSCIQLQIPSASISTIGG